MTQLGARPKALFPRTYKGFRLIRSYGRVYGIPDFLDAEEIQYRGKLTSHPAIVSAPTREELEAQIDGYDAGRYQPELVGTCEGYNLLRLRGSVYAVPQAAGPVDLNLEEDRRDRGVISGQSCEEVRERIRAALGKTPIEFAGWLPVYEVSGNCGRHPQFTHTAEAPEGYRFTNSAPPKRYAPSIWRKGARWLGDAALRVVVALWMLVRPFSGVFRGGSGCDVRGRLRVLGAIIRLFAALRRNGARLLPTLRFLRTRHYQSQLLLANNRGLVFLTSMPYTYGLNPWMIEIEDPTTLFYPLIHNGMTSALDIARSPYYPIVKTLLESGQCKGILTHMKSTAEMVSTLFGSETIRKKIVYTPLGVKLPGRWQRHEETEQVHLLFINSWCQAPSNFFVRGGLDVLEAFAILHERYPQLRLTLRTSLPGLDQHYHRILEDGWVRVINRFLAADEMESLLAESHIFLLPAARVHIVSLLQAMSYGLAVVASDGWGFEEYLDHERNGLIVKGRYGKVSWMDERAGVLREDYEPMMTPDPEVVQGIVEAVSRLVEDRALRKRLGLTARRDVETRYSLERWNRGLKEAFDRARGVGPSLDPPVHTEPWAVGEPLHAPAAR
jgi:glycosyltransferase involved in cell wall biosynthesis